MAWQMIMSLGGNVFWALVLNMAVLVHLKAVCLVANGSVVSWHLMVPCAAAVAHAAA
jgi:hypothetical protein